jgi:hypothetical protein
MHEHQMGCYLGVAKRLASQHERSGQGVHVVLVTCIGDDVDASCQLKCSDIGKVCSVRQPFLGEEDVFAPK